MDADELRSLLPEFEAYLGRFDDCFCDCRSREHLAVYTRGQLSDLDRKSIEPIALAAAVAPRTLQEFLSQLSWDHELMRNRLQEIVVAEHSGNGSVGIFDETTFVKKGTKTPGVQRQWCGHLGKVENCVTTVHLAYTRGDFQCLLDGDLFLPEAWHKDRDRCAAAGIPDTVVYRPKWRIALEQYDRAVANGLRFDWLTFDEGYGSKPEFLAELTKRQQPWVAEVPKSVCGWVTEPRVTERPYRTNQRGRPRTKRRLVSGQPRARRVDELLQRHSQLRDQPWLKYRLDEREKGPSVWEVKHVRFHATTKDGLPGEELHLLMARHVLQGEEVKYFLSNAPKETPTERLLYVALTRHRVERCFQDQKSELGMDHFEGRKYTGLMRHVYLTQVSYLFAMRAVEARRGEKSGVDRAAGPSSNGGSGGCEVAWRPCQQEALGAIGETRGVPPSPQSPGAKVTREANTQPAKGQRHQADRRDSMQTATELAL
jgi:SRSO17 transposase